jgi:hypothetical protein
MGMTAAAWVAVTFGLVELLLGARKMLIMTGLALFLAIGLESVAGDWLDHRGPGGAPGRVERVAAGVPGHHRFFLVYRLIEDYLLVPRVMGRVLKGPALLLAREVLFPRLDHA